MHVAPTPALFLSCYQKEKEEEREGGREKRGEKRGEGEEDRLES